MLTVSRITGWTARVSPSWMKLRRRNSSGARPTAAATRSMMAFERENALRRAESAKGAVRRRVGGDGAAANAHVRAIVGTGGVDRAAREDDRRERLVGAAVDREVDVHGEEFAVARDARCDGACARGGASWWRPCLRRGRRSFSRACRISTRAAPRAPRAWTDILLCRRIRRRFRFGSRGCVFAAGRRGGIERFVHIVGALQRTPDGDAISVRRLATARSCLVSRCRAVPARRSRIRLRR